MQPCLVLPMATAHTKANPNSNIKSSTAIRTHSKNYSLGSQHAFQKEVDEKNPRTEVQVRHFAMEGSSSDQGRRNSQSPPRQRSAGSSHRDEAGSTPNRGSRLVSNVGNGSPRTQLPSFTNLTSGVPQEEDDQTGAKRRRLEGSDGSRPTTRDSSGRPYSSPRQEYDEEDERSYRREMAAARQQAGFRHGPHNSQEFSPQRETEMVESMGRGSSAGGPFSDSRASVSMIEEGYESNVPLARRRGDAAQAKASRLHIDTGSTEAGGMAGSGSGGRGHDVNAQSSNYQSLSSSGHGIAKSAPPHKMSFSERDGGQQLDPRAEPLVSNASQQQQQQQQYQRDYGNGGHVASSQSYYTSSYPSRKSVMVQDHHGFNDAGPAGSNPQGRRNELGSHSMQSHAGHSSHGPATGHRLAGAGAPSVGTPQTAIRSSMFVPQTATLPSPAYHTTHFMRNPIGVGTGPGNSSGAELRGAATPATGGNPTSLAGPPKTAGLNPPMTARLPEHLRSPPSSKTQFLALFSNFYDSLTDSRTLKATLEDQVRRSNTLLQTLQKSSRVLELTVDRRVREERVLWESKVRTLEERCSRLERRLGGGSSGSGQRTEDVPNSAGDEGEQESRKVANDNDDDSNGHSLDKSASREETVNGNAKTTGDAAIAQVSAEASETHDEVMTEKE